MEQSSFFNAEKTANGTYDRTYNAEDWAAYFATFVGNGVSCTPTTNLQVESSSGMNVIVNSGVAFIKGYRYENTTPLTVQINQANSTYDRITSIILELNLNTRNIICTTLDGTAEPNPQPPSLTRTDSIYQLQLATVYVSAGATNCGAITDTRENKEVCGFLELLAPTIQPTFLKNIILQGTTKNAGTIEGGTLNLNLINAPTINQPTINGGGLTNSILNTPHIENGTCLNTNIVLETQNGAKLDYFCDGKSFRLTNPATWEDLITIPESMDEIDVNVPINTNSGTYNNPTLNGGQWTNSTLYEPTVTGSLTLVGGTGIQGGAICNTIFSEEITNEAIITGGTYNNPTLSGNIEVNNSGAQEALIDYYSGTHTQLVAPNVTGKCTISWWLIKAPLLSGQSINGSIGVLTMSITLDSTYNWSNNNRQEIDISQLPASSARTITPTPYFQVGTSQGVLWLAGSNLTLEAGKTYTTKALMWQ
ncbi:hypothetical protein [Clostridium thermobutyricum]|uniref:hypothetical protein n=1 Tax=Clostridium thermobutyricum TaxID=29372 RepID=UPI002942AB28|nr:hypothetical protein [Clostridium thermobutyricum]